VAIVAGPDEEATRSLVRAAHARLVRNLTVVGRPDGAAVPGVPLLADRGLVDGRAAAYVCRGYACRLPVTDPAAVGNEMAAILGG